MSSTQGNGNTNDDTSNGSSNNKNTSSTKHATAMRASNASVDVAKDGGGVSIVTVADTVTFTQHFHF
jgi:hypothetical protein